MKRGREEDEVGRGKKRTERWDNHSQLTRKACEIYKRSKIDRTLK